MAEPVARHADAEEVVGAWLSALEQRDLDRVRSMMAPGCPMIFPGTGEMTDLSELMAWAANRYLRVGKTGLIIETLRTGGVDVVYVRGTLAGDWPDRTPFDGIRFIDRFEVRDGLIVRQDVWNDLDVAIRARAGA